MDKTLQVQLQIRQNAEEISSALKEITSWEKSIKHKDKVVQKQGPVSVRSNQPRLGGGTVPLKTTTSNASKVSSSREVEVITPATIVEVPSSGSGAVRNAPVPKPSGVFRERDLEEIERERGNLEFKNGNFTAAVQSYTRCLGLKKQNFLAFSNRAMAYLKIKEYNRALMDCNNALAIDSTHVKSLLRRATAFNALGRHRAALRDLQKALELEPTNKQAKVDFHHTRELLRNAVNLAPMVNATFVDVEGFQIDGTAEEILFIQGPDLPTSSSTVAAEASSNNVDQCGENSDFHRIVISDEIDVEQGETQEIVVSGATSSVSKKVKKSPTKIKVEKKSNAVTAIKGTYELEKALLAATSIPAKIDLLQILTVKQASKLLQGAMEPDVLYLLLKTVFDVYHMKYLTIDDLLKWLECCSTVSNFSLLFSLLPEKQKAELQNHVSNVSVEQSESDLRFIQRLSGLKRVYN